MKKRFFLIIVTLLFVITLGACNLDNREVEIAASVSFNPEMVEETAQQVKVEVAEQDLTNLEITYKGLNPEIAEISSTGLIKAHAPGEAEFEIEIVADEAKKEISFKVIVKALEYTISYELNGGENSELNPAGFVKSDLPLALQPATKAGYKFAGWELEGEVVEALPEGTTRNVTLVATWELENYAISYDLAGGEHAGEVAATYTILDEVVLGEATKEGYTFLGWYVGEEKIEKIEAGSTGEVALSAKWEAVEYTISYDLVGGAHVGEAVTTYTILDEVVLGKAEKENEEFLGWFLNGELVEVIPAGTTGNIELVAKWQPKSYSITYVLDGGKLEGGYATFEEIGKDFLADFNKYGNCELGAAEFASESHPEVKQALASLEMLTKWQWYFEFMLEDLKSIHGDTTNSYVTETYSVLEKIIALDTTAIEISANARTLIRFYSGGMMQGIKGSDGNPTFSALCADFSETARQEALFKAANKALAYTVEDEVVLPTPAKEGYIFLGWYNAAGEKQEKIEKGTTGDLVITAKWESEVKVESEIEYVLDGGVLPEGAKSTYVEGEGLSTLPVPTKEGYKFLGWYQGENKVEAISSEATGKVTLTAKWEEKIVEPETPVKVVYVGEGKDYATLDEAVQGVEDGTKIVLAAGEYSLSVVIAKSVIIEGPNANQKAPANQNPEALINVAKDVAGNLAAKNIEFNGVHLKGTGGGAGIPGISFQDGGNIEKLVFKSCVISDTNTFLKFVGGASNLELVFDSCHIHTIGQFVLWTTTAVNKTLLIGNQVDGSSCGAVTNAAAALFRVRHGSLEAYNNVFNGDSQNLPGYFECSAGASIVKYNTFFNTTLFVHPTTTNNVVFDQNLYLFEGVVADKAPASLMGTGVTADKTVAKSQEEVEMLYLNYLLTSDPSRYFEVSFNANGGTITSLCPSVYDKEEGIAVLPTIEREGFTFGGWYVNGVKVESIVAGTTGKLEVIAQWIEDCLVVDGTTAEGHYATIADALAAAKDGDIIRLAAGEYTENVTISVPNLTIKGPNAGIDAVNGQRVAEAVVKGVFTVTSQAPGLTIDGLAFTGDAKIKYTESKTYEGFTFQNNKVYDTTAASVAWDESRYTLPGFIQFTMASGGTVNNTQILNNSFVNVSEINVLVNRAINISVDNNEFKDFDLDAIRIEGGYAYGALGFTNNVFEQSVEGNGNVGIFFYSIAGASDAQAALVLIENNTFIKVGRDNGTVFTSAIAAYRFQENYTSYTIKNNVFDHCYDYLYIRNNGGNSSNWFLTVEDNQFLGLPHNQYYGSYRGSDSESTNPHLAVFTKNYYEDNEGKVISDLSAYAAYFKHMGSYGTALGTKPSASEAERVEFWTISYNLNEGTTKESFTYEYTTLHTEAIALPTLTKPNHQFNGWLLNGELVTVIPAGTKGNLELVADFSMLEGEVYEIKFNNPRENAVWPSRAAEDREEIIAELFEDLYAWAVANGETKSYAAYEEWLRGQLAAYSDIKLRNTELGSYPAEDGSTEYFLNIPKNFQKWNDFFQVFNTAMLAVNGDQNFYKDTYATMVRLNQFVIWSSTGQNYFASYIPKMCAATKVPAEIPTSYRGGQVVELPVLSMENGLAFLGWYDNAEFNGEPITTIKSTDTGNKEFFAKWDKEVLAEKLEINDISELLLFTTHQLVWSITPENTTNKEVEFFSSNEAVATVSPKGLITALANGTTTITVRVYGNRQLDLQFEVTVYVNDYIDGSYESNSFAKVGEEIQINAEVVKKDGSKGSVVWKSLNPEIATVDENGIVKAVKAGIAKIVATDATNEALSIEFEVTVLEETISEALDFILRNHESNIFTRYNLGIGSGTPDYYMDIFGSANKLLGNEALEIDSTRKDMEVEAKTGDYFENMKSVEFITVHYTGNMASGADAKANANYFVGDNAVSIHYTTGNDGVYQCLDHSYGAWHAGDSGALAQVGEFKWTATGVKVAEGDPLYPVFTISKDFYYEINGQKTTIPMARPWNYENRGTDHILNSDGTISTQANYGQTGFQNREPESFINDQSLPFIIVDGEYYMGSTWWCYTQVYEGRICSTGGNRNSIGIESCVNKGSDLWYTWQLTAKLVAKLMLENNLDITRVRGHHFFSGKDCPQPMLENYLEIWWEFLELVEAEYELLTEYSDYEIKFESHNPDILDDNGRIVKQPTETTTVSYTVTITKDGKSESVTLSSVIKGIYVDR